MPAQRFELADTSQAVILSTVNVSAPNVPGQTRPEIPKRSSAQTRVLDAAMALFADHGVSGTSLQMIADAIGVTKAAVYRQFKAKEDIVIAATERELA